MLGFCLVLLIFTSMDHGFGERGMPGTASMRELEMQIRRDLGLDTILRLREEVAQAPKVNLGDTINFWTINATGTGYISIPAICMSIGEYAYMFVEVAEVEAGHMTQSMVDYLTMRFDSITVTDSMRGVYEIVTDMFGDPPLPPSPHDIDGDSLIYILLLDVRRPGVAGYFSPWNQGTGAFSNRKEMFYVDTRFGQHNAVIAHEFQHLVNWNMDTDEELWINEGAATLAELLVGPSLWPGHQYVQNTDVSLTSWGGQVSDYERVFFWTTYLWERVGDEGIRTMVQRQENGIAGIDSMLQQLGFAERFIDIHRDYAIALFMDNPDTTFYGGRFGFKNLDIPSPSMEFVVSQYPDFERNEYLVGTGIDYIWFRILPDSLTIGFGGFNVGTTFRYYPYVLHGNSPPTIEIVNEFALDENYDGQYASVPAYSNMYMVVVGGRNALRYTLSTLPYTGVEEDQGFVGVSNFQLEICPNPASSVIRFTFSAGATPSNVEIYDIAGREIDSFIARDESFEYNIRVLSPGLYFYRATSFSGEETSGNFVVIR
ncbi:T9SS type A sorting domain-containing protein [candidate division WOR-3 bacterium]|nr:T9SS type A sorting domain-containing protein [candidate division WOR-3 bacterium]